MEMKDARRAPIRILIADDHVEFRSALRALLEKGRGLEVVAEASDGWNTLRAVEDYEVDLVLLDLNMPGLSGLQVAEKLARERQDIAIVVVTMHEDENYLQEFMKMGVRGFVLKKSVVTALLRAVRTAYEGGRYVDPDMHLSSVPSLHAPAKNTTDGGLDELTAREREVCRLLARGHTTAEMARQLLLSEEEVGRYRSNIMEKLGVTNRAELVRFAVENGLLRLD
jgi:two-component system response regulator NreC